MGVISKSLSAAHHPDDHGLARAHKAFEKRDFKTCAAVLIEGIAAAKERMITQPHSKRSRLVLAELWQLSVALIVRPKPPQWRRAAQATQHTLLQSIRSFFFDFLIEKDWKKQYQGKYGGAKKKGCSWKQSYFQHEKAIAALTTVEENVRWAIMGGHVAFLKRLLEQERSFMLEQLHFEEDLPALSVAIKQDHYTLFLYLCECKHSNIQADAQGWTPLHYAVHTGNRRMIEELLKETIPLDLQNNDGQTVLHMAVIHQFNDIVLTLLTHKATPNLSDKHGLTPLYYAMVGCNRIIAEHLIKHGAACDVCDGFGRSLLHTMVILNESTMVDVLLQQRCKLNDTDQWGRTPTHYAAMQPQSASLEVLIDAGADTQVTDRFEDTPLRVAAFHENGAAIALLHQAANA